MPRFFVPTEQIPTISGQDAHQIKAVLRMKVGDELELLDGSGKVYFAKILEIKNDKVTTKILSTHRAETDQKVKATIAQCLPKHKKMDLIIQKCTELGVAKIIPTLSERSIAKGEKLERWQKIAKEAAEQSGRGTLPEITNLTKFEDVLAQGKNYKLALIPWELEKEKSLKASLSTHPSPHTPILILIGPEGGFSQKEVEQAQQAGFIPISLGKRILRTETAGLSILSMINYHFDQ
ncbi:MAG: 16S rRNA (uracil(1498)-N(3))-methyltransferase [bacterium]|nr:16S rRNA (uracil(1498)-N(3))-methyltransferase [Candidatus Margulisiibacteriota bacterium]